LAANSGVLNLWLAAAEKRNERAGRFAHVTTKAGPHAGRTFAVEARHFPTN
jgi:hypothetical protein